MKQKLLPFFVAILLFAACKNEKKEGDTREMTADTKTTESKENFTMPDSATMMKNWQEYSTPGEMHKMMASWDGTWEGEITSWDRPDMPTKSTGSAVFKTVLNGLYQESVHTGNMMGMEFEGHGTLAYDNHSKEFISTWIDNFGSGVMILKGPWDPATKSMTLTGNCYNAAAGRNCDYKEVFKVVDENHTVMEMYGPGMDGKEAKMMEIKSTRK